MVGMNEDFLKRQKPPHPTHDHLSPMDKDIIGSAVRIEIPFADVYNMRRIADLLRGYASTLDLYSRDTHLPARTILFHLKSEAKALNFRIREMTGKGKTAKPYRRNVELDETQD